MTEQVMVINDWPGAAKVAGASNLPILTAAQFEVAFLPTVILSTHTKNFPGLVKRTLEEDFRNILNHWVEIELDVKACLVGYFASTDQMQDVLDYLDKNNAPLIVDPIMADDGKLYLGFDESFPVKMRELVARSELVFPNLTEACLLTGTTYKEQFDIAGYDELCSKLIDLGARNVVLSGIRNDKGEIGYYVKGKEISGQAIWHEKSEHEIKGIGDLAASLLTAYYLLEVPLVEAVERSIPHITKAINETVENSGRSSHLGLYFEPIIPEFSKETYELRNK